MSNFSQMAGLAVQNFVSAAVGISVAIAFVIRGVAARSGTALGNYYVDLFRTLALILLPVSVVFGLFLVLQGVPQSIDLPVASQEVIKELGTNGGGVLNVNSAHPFENPTWLSNFVEMLLILAIPAGLTAHLRPDGRQPPPGLGHLRRDALALRGGGRRGLRRRDGIDPRAWTPPASTGINMEGKEQRFGTASTALWVVITTAASCGAVNGAMEALTGIGGPRPDGPDADRRGDLRRRRLRASTGC